MEDLVQEPDPGTVRAARGGDLDAFEQLVRRYQAEVWRLSLQLVGNRAAADDVTQEAFLRAYRFLSRYRGDSKFSTWLFSIARNCALDEIRRAGRRRRVANRLDAEPARPPADHTVRVEVREALSGLPADLREPIVFIDLLGLSYKDVASMLRLPLGTVKSRVHRGREILARVLTSRDEESVNDG
jgi:RNA polymerase sigma-70 factor (ECF subfamily)